MAYARDARVQRSLGPRRLDVRADPVQPLQHRPQAPRLHARSVRAVSKAERGRSGHGGEEKCCRGGMAL